MNKSKLAVGLLTAMLSVGALASCDNTVKYSNDGTILIYKDGDGVEHPVTADELFTKYYSDSSKYQSIFDAINSIVIRNYFTIEEKISDTVTLGKPQMEQIKSDARFKVETDKKTAKTNADNNGTSYSKEFDAILSSKGVDSEEKLLDKYVEELQKTTFEENFYKYHINDIKMGANDVAQMPWDGYFKAMQPYHVSHILVKLEDGSGTNYSNGTISKENAEKLYEVVSTLKDGTDSFGTVAYRFSEDTGSAKSYGDLGIMDYSTGYVNEFKLGIYAYENFVGNYTEAAKDSVIGIPNEDALLSVVADSFNLSEPGVPEIDYSVFELINEAAKTVKDGKDKAVLDDSANFYPRNIIYNRFLNRHFVAFIKNDTGMDEAAEAVQTTGFKKYEDGSELDNGKYYLSVKVAGGWTPILCTRAGSDYQGIHFIIVNRSPFAGEGTDKKVAGVSLNDYYTTYYPEQDDYPGKKDGSPLKTYINFSSSITTDTKARAESLKSTLKSFDSDRLNKYIFMKFFQMEGIKITDEELEATLTKWITRGFEKKAQEQADAWEKTWNDYVDTLSKQNTERKKLVSQACRIGYSRANEDVAFTEITDLVDEMAQAMVEAGEFTNTTDAKKAITTLADGTEITKLVDMFKKEGGLCNDGKAHL